MSEFVSLGDTVRFHVSVTHPVSGFYVNADATPRYMIFKDDSDTVTLQGDFTLRTGFKGQYRASAAITSANTFASGNYVSIYASGMVEGRVNLAKIKEFVVSDVFNANVVQVSGQNVHTSDLTNAGVWSTPIRTLSSASGITNSNLLTSTNGILSVNTIQVSGQTLHLNDINRTGMWNNATRTLSAATNITSTGGTITVLGGLVDANVMWVRGGTNPASGLAMAGLSYFSNLHFDADVMKVNHANLITTPSGLAVPSYVYGTIPGQEPLKPTVANRTLDVTATGAAGIDWGNVENQSTVVVLNNSIIGTATNVSTVTLVNSIGPSGILQNSLHSNAYSNIGTSVWANSIRTLTSASGITSSNNLTSTNGILDVNLYSIANNTSTPAYLNGMVTAFDSTGSLNANVTTILSDGSTTSYLNTLLGNYNTNGSVDSNVLKWVNETVNVSANNIPLVDVNNILDVDSSSYRAIRIDNNNRIQTDIVSVSGSNLILTPSGYAVPSYVYGFIPGQEPLKPGVANRTLNITATGATAIDWGNIENKTTWNNLSDTYILNASTVTTVTNISNPVVVATNGIGRTALTTDTYNHMASGVWTNPVRALTTASGICLLDKITVTGGYIDVNVERWDSQAVSVNDSNVPLVSTSDLYYCNIKYLRENPVGSYTDRYAVQWYKNGSAVNSGELTNPRISVYNSLTGGALISHGIMSYSSPVLGQVYYQSSNPTVQTSGIPYLVAVSGTIGSAVRQWNQIVGLDLL